MFKILSRKHYNDILKENNIYKELISNIIGINVNINGGNTLIPIQEYKFPEVVLERTKKELNITDNELQIVILDFFDYIKTIQIYKGQQIDMLSKTTDVLWHNLILDTKSYLNFCLNYVGFFVHHEPYNKIKELTIKEKEDLSYKYQRAIGIHFDYVNFRQNIINKYTNKSNNSYRDLLTRSTYTENNNNNGDFVNNALSFMLLYSMLSPDEIQREVKIAERANELENLENNSNLEFTDYETSEQVENKKDDDTNLAASSILMTSNNGAVVEDYSDNKSFEDKNEDITTNDQNDHSESYNNNDSYSNTDSYNNTDSYSNSSNDSSSYSSSSSYDSSSSSFSSSCSSSSSSCGGGCGGGG